MNILTASIETFRGGKELPEDDLSIFFDALLSETDEDTLSAVLQAWTERGVSEDELYGIASIMRERCTRISSPHQRFVDVVGTGGSRVKTFNVSTAAAFVTAGAGVAVAKHGNRAASSSTGSADVMSELGVQPAVDSETAARCLKEIGICFMFAPNFHRLSPVLGKVRRALGYPTIFNILGPLCNPAGAPHHLIGVWDASLLGTVSSVLARLGTDRSWVVSGTDGLDEITLDGDTNIAEVRNGDITRFTISPEDVGFDRSKLDSVRVATPVESAGLIRRVLEGHESSRPAANLVLMSSAAAIHLASDLCLADALASAQESIDSGAASEKLIQLAAMTNK